MSLFIGPVHKKVYRSIINQDKLNNYLIKKYNLENEIKKMNGKFGFIIDGDLEDLIDTSNIHGWLEARVNTVNSKFAFINSKILLNNLASLEELKEALANYGKALSKNTDNISDYYNLMEDTFIDGMPCDFIIKKVEENVDHISWRIDDIQDKYWTYGVDRKIYFELRNAFMIGMLDGSQFNYTYTEDKIFEINRKLG